MVVIKKNNEESVDIPHIEMTKEEAIENLRKEMIEEIPKWDSDRYRLDYLEKNVPVYFPNESFEWQYADFVVEIDTHKLLIHLNNYPSTFGPTPKRDIPLYPDEMKEWAQKLNLRPELQVLETGMDWYEVFDDEELQEVISEVLKRIRR